MLFSMGGLFSIYEGWHKLHAHGAAATSPGSRWWCSVCRSCSSSARLLGCLREIKKLRKGRSLGYWVKNTRNAELVVVLGEDVAALVGLVIAFVFVALAAVTGNPVFDAIGSIAIGVVLMCVSIFVAVRIKGLIVGRSAEDDLQEALRAEVAADPDIDELLNAITMQMGPEVMLALEGAHARRAHASKRRSSR